MKTLKNNKLIAEFLSIKIHPCETIENFKFLPIEERGLYNGYFIDALKYHEDWNWLMEVVEKIESIEYGIYQVDILQEGCKILERCRLLIDKRVGKLESDTTKIESVYLACVEFIKWYNNQNKVS